MGQTVALWVALAAFAAGLAYKVSSWFRHGLAPAAGSAGSRVLAAARGIASALFSARLLVAIEALVLDVILQRRILKLGVARWLAHVSMSAAFVALLLMHALGTVLTARLFPGYQSTLNPFLLLRDLLGAFLLAGLLVAAYRRWALRVPRRETRPSDAYALALIAVILGSGLLLEATKIGSYAAFRGMAEQYAGESDRGPLEAYWAAEMGTVAPGPHSPELVARGREAHESSCAACHSPARSAFLGYATAAVLRPVSAWLDGAGAPGILWAIHFYACLLGLALLPFSKMFHLLATPLALVVNAVAARGEPSPANLATKQMIELDACTHCCACSARCSMAMASDAVGNPSVLPSEKMAALKALASGREIGAERQRALQEGVCLCTSCERCTVACPSGIDLVGLWTSAREALLARGEPEFSLLSPLSMRRGLRREAIDPVAYRQAIDRPLRAVAERAGGPPQPAGALALAPGDGRLWRALRASPQASTVGLCFGCKTCSTACPVVRSMAEPAQALGLLPHQITYAARLGLWGLVFGSRMLWDCLGCYQCQEHCPQGVDVADVMYELRNLAIARAAAPARAETGGRP
jgi:heterodisulfide reductase subunit C/nitrate reductase gamma subunit